jgi:hypothetical protein
MGLIVTYRSEGEPGETWDKARQLEGARDSEGERGRVITIKPRLWKRWGVQELPDGRLQKVRRLTSLEGVTIQVFPGGTVKVAAPNLYEFGKALGWVQDKLRIFRSESYVMEPQKILNQGTWSADGDIVVVRRPAPNVLEEWIYSSGDSEKFSRRYRMTWRTIRVG